MRKEHTAAAVRVPPQRAHKTHPHHSPGERAAIARSIRCDLVENWPKAFARAGFPKRPIKLKIIDDIMAKVPDTSRDHVSIALKDYVSGFQYLASCIEGAIRLNLFGSESGRVSRSEADFARAQLRKLQGAEGVYNDQLKSIINHISYDFVRHEGRVDQPAGCCVDMSGAIAFFKSIDQKVRRITTFAGGKTDTAYQRHKSAAFGWLVELSFGKDAK